MAQAKLRGLLVLAAILALGAEPAREDKNDCEDCVIVRPEGSGVPEGGAAGSSGMAGPNALAGTLWGLFMVARPKRMPRTIIRGVTVP